MRNRVPKPMPTPTPGAGGGAGGPPQNHPRSRCSKHSRRHPGLGAWRVGVCGRQGSRIRGLWYPTPSRRHPDPVARRVAHEVAHEAAQELAHRVFNAGGRPAAKPRCSKPSRRHREAMFYVERRAEGLDVQGSAGGAGWRRGSAVAAHETLVGPPARLVAPGGAG